HLRLAQHHYHPYRHPFPTRRSSDLLQPKIALPHQPDQVVSLGEAVGKPIQQAFIGTCTGGRYSDLAAAAEVLRGHKTKIRFVVIDRKSTRLNSSHQIISYAVFCLKK